MLPYITCVWTKRMGLKTPQGLQPTSNLYVYSVPAWQVKILPTSGSSQRGSWKRRTSSFHALVFWASFAMQIRTMTLIDGPCSQFNMINCLKSQMNGQWLMGKFSPHWRSQTLYRCEPGIIVETGRLCPTGLQKVKISFKSLTNHLKNCGSIVRYLHSLWGDTCD